MRVPVCARRLVPRTANRPGRTEMPDTRPSKYTEMQSNLNFILTLEHNEDLRRAADHDRLVRSAVAARRSETDQGVSSRPIGLTGRRPRRIARALAWALRSTPAASDT